MYYPFIYLLWHFNNKWPKKHTKIWTKYCTDNSQKKTFKWPISLWKDEKTKICYFVSANGMRKKLYLPLLGSFFRWGYIILNHIIYQGQWPRRVTTRPRSGGYAGARGPKGATPLSRSGEKTSSKLRSSGCALLESREEISHDQGKRNPGKTVGVARGHQRAETLKS